MSTFSRQVPTPFFLRGSGYAEGTLFPWTMSDFSLMDAIECGIVKLPRVPAAENIPGDEMPVYRNLWENIRKDMPKKGRGSGGELDPLKPDAVLATHSLRIGVVGQIWIDFAVRLSSRSRATSARISSSSRFDVRFR